LSQKQEKINILIIIICSYHKRTNQNEYNSKLPENFSFSRFGESLTPEMANTLYQKRRAVFDLLKSGNVFWHNSDENRHPYNQDLIIGEDLDPGHQNPKIVYMPAICRYYGRFFKELKENGLQNVTDPEVHVLILSGLYGFVLPNENIQLYSVPIEWGSNVQRVWKDNAILTKILLDYINQQQISHVFDLTARQDYRETIEWELVRPVVEVRHCFSKLGAGNDALEDFAHFIREQAPKRLPDALLSLDFDKNPENNLSDYLYCRSVAEEWDGFPKERKSIPLEKGVLNLEEIKDYTTRQIFLTAERMFKVIYNFETVGEDAGSIFFVLYGKGLEVLLDKTITKGIRNAVFAKYTPGRIPNFISLPRALKGALRANDSVSIPLGGWHRLKNDCQQSNHPVAHIVLQYLNSNLGKNFSIVGKATRDIANLRNPGAHSDIQTIDDFLDGRKRVIERINQVIQILYNPSSS
jgi:hypothetical protein